MATTVVNRHDHPDFDVYIGRGTPWGNPFIVGVHGNLPQVIKRYEENVRAEIQAGTMDLTPLIGKRLACSCKPKPCHGDVLVKLIKEIYGAD